MYDCADMAGYGLRRDDLRELAAAHGDDLDAYAVLLEALRLSGSNAFVFVVDGQPAAMFGVAPVTAGVGAPWFLATPRVYRAATTLARYTRPWVEWMNGLYPELVNVALTENQTALRWLEHAGFELLPPAPMGPRGTLFTPFMRRRSHV